MVSRPLFARGSQVIERDVCVIGGGSAGTYLSVRLGDFGKSVVLLESTDHLGGHAQTYMVPGSGIPIDVGVVDFEQTPVVLNYFNRFGIAYGPGAAPGGSSAYIDLRTGLPLANYTPPSAAAIGEALENYYQILTSTYPYLDDGFQLPDPVPQELVEPFSSFVTNHGLQALVPTIFAYGQGAGNLLQDPALYVLKLFGLNVVSAILGGGFLNLQGGTVQLYSAATQYLGSNVVFNAQLRCIDRSGAQIKVAADTPAGPVTIHCNKLVWAAPPTLSNLAPVDLDVTEASVFGKLQSKCYAVGLASISGLPEGLSINNLAPDTPYNLPPLPGIYILEATVPWLYLALFGSENPLGAADIEMRIARQVASLAQAGTYPAASFEGFQLFSNHTPFLIGVSGADIAAGFYTRMNALQGYRNTYYNSAAFQTNDSSLIWQFTEQLLPQIVG
ncbi:hypothetical protein GCM10027066_26190 [Dyella jejuensis]